MAFPKSLRDLSLDVIYDDAERIINHISKSAKKDRARLVSTLRGLINMFKSRVIPSASARLLSQASETSPTTATNLSRRESQTDFNYEKRMQLKIVELTNKIKGMAEMINEREAELNETLSELGRVSVELTKMENEKKRNEVFKKTYKSQTTATQTSGNSEVATSISGAWSNQATLAMVETHRTENGNQLVGHDASFPRLVKESLSETESLTSAPNTSGAERNIYNNYKLLLLKLASGLLADDLDKLKEWVEIEFQIDSSSDVNTIFQELDRKKAINITDLGRLKKFFEDNVRYDLVHLIDSYILGEYEQLRSFKTTAGSGICSTQNGLTNRKSISAVRPSRPSSSEIGHTSRTSQGPTRAPLGTVPVYKSNFSGISRSKRYVPLSLDGESSGLGKDGKRNVGGSKSQGVVVADEEGTNGNESGRRACSARARRDGADTSRNSERGSNGQKLSKFSRPDSSGDELDDNWFCSHYQRRCYVRIHGDRSFHCDICSVCLDGQLRGNHKCREGSAHDKCCICLEDAFTACQILPCSHKVHKECVTKMISSGKRRCPICRECFEDKQERKLPPSKKPPGEE